MANQLADRFADQVADQSTKAAEIQNKPHELSAEEMAQLGLPELAASLLTGSNAELIAEELASFNLSGAGVTEVIDAVTQVAAQLTAAELASLGLSETGVAAVIDAIRSVAGTTLRAVIAMVDARALLHDHGGGLDLVERMTSPVEDAPCAADLLAFQLQSASVIALTKADLVPEAELEGLLRSLHAINPEATLTACVYGKLDARLVLEAAPYRGGVMEQRLPDQGTAQRYDIGTTVVRNSRPLHPQRFHTLYRDRLGLGIFRSKGFIWLASRPADVLLWNQAGGAMGLEWLATWRIAILEGQGGHPLLLEEKDHLKKALLGTHPLFGDRGNELTVIGHARDRAVFCRELEECFCTDEEVEHWRQGGSFPDPWPTRIRET
jgi:G3E family GTPase